MWLSIKKMNKLTKNEQKMLERNPVKLIFCFTLKNIILQSWNKLQMSFHVLFSQPQFYKIIILFTWERFPQICSQNVTLSVFKCGFLLGRFVPVALICVHVCMCVSWLIFIAVWRSTAWKWFSKRYQEYRQCGRWEKDLSWNLLCTAWAFYII